MQKRTKEEFVEAARKVHGDKYDYSKVVYVNNTTPVIIICPIHGEFEQTPKHHLNGCGCQKCGRSITRASYKQFLKRSCQKFGDKFLYPNISDEYYNKYSIITVVCKDCNNQFKTDVTSHLSSRFGKCDVCKKEANTTYYIYEDLVDFKASNIEIEYFPHKVTKHDKINCICPIHGQYEVLVSTILKGKGQCKKCSSKPADVTKVIEKFESEFGNKLSCDFSSYKNQYTPLEFTCLECGHNFKRPLSALFNQDYKDVCPRCSKHLQNKEQTKTTEQFIEDVKRVHGENVFDFSPTVYVSSSEHVALICKECGRLFTIEANSLLQGHGCPHHFHNKSQKENEVAEYIKTLGVNVITNDRTLLNGQEVDIFLPDFNISIEFDGVFWHNENNKPNDYHINKTIACENKGVRLIHIFEDEWVDKSDIWKSMLSNILGYTNNRIYARKCEIKEVSGSDSVKFLNDNHIQGTCPSSIKLGLYYNNELVSLMTFGKSRHFIGNGKYEYELLRFCNKTNVSVIGGASKLFKYFCKTYNPTSVISYADRRWSIGNMYKQLGFEFLHSSKPNYYYVINNKRKNRFNFRKSELVRKYNIPQNMSEREYCYSQKWYRIYDCGCLCYGWHKKSQ